MTKLKMQSNVPLAPFTTWKIGGKAKYFTAASSSEELKQALDFAKNRKIKFFILGGGSNLLVSDDGFKGLVIKLAINHIKVKGQIIAAGGGAMMSRVAVIAHQNRLSGLEWAVGLPGTVGGAVFGNSNSFGGSAGQSLRKAKLMTLSGKTKSVNKDYFHFGYDYSKLLRTSEILVEAEFKLQRISEQKNEIMKSKISDNAAQRYTSQPLGEACAGSVFKAIEPTAKTLSLIRAKCPCINIPLRDNLISAGFVIDKCLNLKGFVLHKMKISEKHANFFINQGGSSAKNAKKLIDYVKKECNNKLGIKLQEEIKYLGKF